VLRIPQTFKEPRPSGYARENGHLTLTKTLHLVLREDLFVRHVERAILGLRIFMQE